MATDIGQYRGVSIKPGDQASVAAQLKAIDASFGNTTVNGATAPIGTASLPGMDTNVLSGNATQPNMPPPVAPTTNPSAFVAGISALPPVPLAPSGAGVGAQNDTRTALTKRLQDASSQLLGEGAREAQLDVTTGYTKFQKNIADLNAEILAKKASFDQAQENFRSGQVGTQEMSTGKIAQVQRNAAVVLGGLSALLMGQQGQLEAARAEIDRTLKQEFDPIRQEIENTMMFLDINNQDLTRAESRQAEATRNALTRELNNTNLLESRKNDLLKNNLNNPEAYRAILEARNNDELAKAQANIKSQETGIPSDVAEKIGESKVGQKVNANIAFSNSVQAYKALYEKYYNAGNLISFEAQKSLATLRGDLEQAYSAANGQGAVQEGDRESYKKIISGGVFMPKLAIASMNSLLGAVDGTIKNDIKFLDTTYGGYGTPFFSSQIQKGIDESVDPQTKLQTFYDQPYYKSWIEKINAQYPNYGAAEILQIIQP